MFLKTLFSVSISTHFSNLPTQSLADFLKNSTKAQPVNYILHRKQPMPGKRGERVRGGVDYPGSITVQLEIHSTQMQSHSLTMVSLTKVLWGGSGKGCLPEFLQNVIDLCQTQSNDDQEEEGTRQAACVSVTVSIHDHHGGEHSSRQAGTVLGAQAVAKSLHPDLQEGGRELE